MSGDGTTSHEGTPRPGEFCHRHFSWLCQAGQGDCQRGDDYCGCYACIGDKPAHEGSWLTVGMTRMIVCASCGNKRCPHGTDHRNACTASNEPNQPGSRYQYAPLPSGVDHE